MDFIETRDMSGQATAGNDDLVLAISPCGVADPGPRLVAEARRGGALAALDLADGGPGRLEALGQAVSWSARGLGVRVPAGCAASSTAVRRASANRVDLVVLDANAAWDVAETVSWARVLVDITSQTEARAAAAAGASGLIARGAESGGRVSELSTFVLLQQLLADEELALPVWAAGGIGLRTAAACVVGGATGVVLDSQLALMPESDLPDDVVAALRQMDGSEGTAGGHLHGIRLAGHRHGSRSERLLPIGQDGCQAVPFARRWRGTADAVKGVRSAILQALRDREAGRALLPGAPLASSLRIGVPVAQGPMTRVSDEPAFAASVANGGGLPFIALALADRERSAAMLRATSAMLGERPWGVGILGFTPDELRAAQLDVVREIRPSCAIIAGGRPSQAAALEQAGIPTFLHVPSPKLLRLFLQAGSRRFVFEGAECGGHVGPRTSFSLWEAQLDVIDEFLDSEPAAAAQIQCWFAGGIHDARSAAMIAALAAPLSRRGGQIGLLMGTAYLFTREAVRESAVAPLFQRKAVAARATALIQTAPGQSIRCLASRYVDEFERKRAGMSAAGLDKREIWQQLELMNIGRLRLASKGLEHDGTRADEATQSARGMYMAGQIAVLRDSTTTIAELHYDVSVGADRFYGERLDALRARLTPATPAVREPPAPLDVAVIGMACAFPGSADLDGFWNLILNGTSAIGDVPRERWNPAACASPRAAAGGKRRGLTGSGGFLEPVPIDPVSLGIPPGALGRIDPAQLIALEIARQTLADAGYRHDAPEADHSRTGVIFGAQGGSELEQGVSLRALLPAYLGALPRELGEQVPQITKDTFPGLLANVIAGRVANRLDLGGPSFIVDAACAASLAAVDVACKNLLTGAADLMLCGGIDLHNSLLDFILFDSVHALSEGGRLRAFDSAADGTVLGEGAGCVVLKRLADARRDGDRIYAVITGTGAANDGRSVSLTAPHSAGPLRAMRQAYRQAGIQASRVGLVEAHGTGTAAGDEIELESLTSHFTGEGARPGSCVLGSVKSQIGHTKGAAGIAGLIKAVLSVYHGIQPPTMNLDKPVAAWDSEHSPFGFLTRPRPWTAPAQDRIAAVSALGFGGGAFHLVLRGLEGTPVPRYALREWPAELFCFRGSDRAAAQRVAGELAAELSAGEAASWRRTPGQLRMLAEHVATRHGPRAEPVQLAIVARDTDELVNLLGRALAGQHEPTAGLIQPPGWPSGEPLGVAFLFPGQGSQRPAALRDLFVHFAEMRPYLEARPDVANLLFPAAVFDAARQRELVSGLRRTSAAQPALGISGLAVNHLLRRLGILPDMTAGHSYGELVALCVAGAYDGATLLDLSHERAEAILSSMGAEPGTMAAVSGTAEDTAAILSRASLPDEVVLANHNAPRQVTISGPTQAVARAVQALREAGLPCSDLPVACAFHSPVLAGAGARFAGVLESRAVTAPRIPVWSNRTAAPYPRDAGLVRAELAAQVESPVRFAEQVESMYEAGARVFIEAGPGRVLTGLVREILTGRPHLAVACDAQPDEGMRGFLTTLAELACSGVPVNTALLLRGRDAARCPAGQEPEPGWFADGALVRDSSGAAARGSVTPPGNVKEWTMTTYPSAANGPSREELLADYLRLSREAVHAHRDVMLAAFGGPPGVPAVGGMPGVPAGRTLEVTDATGVRQAQVSAAGPAAVARDDLADLVITAISESTGYPVDMVESDLDLEAELGIDSIKRAEIAGDIALRLGMSGDEGDYQFEELLKARTVNVIVDWLREQTPGQPGHAPTDGQASTAAVADPAAAPREPDPGPTGKKPCRLVPTLVTAGLGQGQPKLVKGARFLITGDTKVGDELTAELGRLGALSLTWRPDQGSMLDLTRVDGLISLDGLSSLDGPAGSGRALPVSLFPVIKAALGDSGPPARQGLCRLLVASADARPDSAGLAGLLRTVHREYPWAGARHVAFDRVDQPAEVAGWLIRELLNDAQTPAVSYRDGVRYIRELAPAELALAADSPGDAAAAQAIGLSQDCVVVVVGGARGIATGVARACASLSGCRIELIGRTALPQDEAESPDTAAAADLPALRAALSANGTLASAEVDRSAKIILAQREVRGTIAELRSLGSPVSYRCLDVLDTGATRQAVEAIHAAFGRIDGLVFAAGVIEDKLIADKTPESFARVFDTKVAGAQAFLDALDARGCKPRFTVLFGSLSAYGSRGQADYAAANDALEALGARWSARSGSRCLTVHWGPWAPAGAHAGMVSPGLARRFAKRGIGLIDPDEGVRCLLRELAWGDPAATAVAYAAPAQDSPTGATAYDLDLR